MLGVTVRVRLGLVLQLRVKVLDYGKGLRIGLDLAFKVRVRVWVGLLGLELGCTTKHANCGIMVLQPQQMYTFIAYSANSVCYHKVASLGVNTAY